MTSEIRKSPRAIWNTRHLIVAFLASAAMLVLAAISCTEVVVVTVEVEVTREVPVTRIVEVTREVEAAGRLARDTVGTAAAVEACLDLGDLLLTFLGSFDSTTGLPSMTEEEAGRSMFPIISKIYDSGDEGLIFAINKILNPAPDITEADIQAIFVEIVTQCGRFVQW